MKFPDRAAPAPSSRGVVPPKGKPTPGSHRIFRPGVRLFRRLRFGSKAWIISATFLLPLLLFAASYGASNRDAWQVAESERAGVQAMRQLAPRLQALARGQADPRLLEEVNQVSIDSGLILDPAAASYFAMDAAVLKLPLMVQLRGALEGGGDAAQARWQDARDALKGSLALLAKEDPARAAALRADTVLNDPPAPAAEVLALQERALNLLDELLAERMAAQRLQVLRMVVVTGLSLAAAAYLFYSFALVLGGGIRFVTDRVNHVADGVLTGPSHAWGQDEFAYVASRVAEMQKSLVATMAKVTVSANQVATASREMSQATGDLASRTANATSRLREAAGSMGEMRGLVDQTAQQTQAAADEAQRNAEVAVAGGAEVAEAVSTMDEVRQSATRIHDIISLIDSIAFQTNILALNAAVEAARAGEQGRGFAVVASEVRMLAGRSAEAAKEIKSLIQTSVEQSERGAAKVGQAGQTMRKLVDSATALRGVLQDMRGYAQQQAQRMSQVAVAVRELDEMTSHNAAMVEQTSGAAQSMMQQAAELAAEADRFHLPEDVAPASSLYQ